MARAVTEGIASAKIERSEEGVRFNVLSWELAVYAVILIAAIALRFWDLGARALHHDESLHATFSWYFASGRGYVHDPLMHGPFQFHANALVFKLFGDNDYTARVAAAVFGSILVFLPFLLRKQLGRVGAVTASLLLAVSPTVLYFSRFTREDIFFAVFTFGLVICLFRYLDSGRTGWLMGASAMLALSFATKEVAFMTAALVITYLNGLIGVEFWQTWRSKRERSRIVAYAALVGFLLGAWLLVLIWPFSGAVRKRFGPEELTPAAVLLLIMGTLAVPQAAAAIQLPFDLLGIPFRQGTASLFGYDFRGAGSPALLSILVLIGLSGYVGTAWDPKRWLLCAAAFYVPYVLLYTTFFDNNAGFGSGIWGSLDYWLGQHDVRRGDQPPYYYAMLIPIYEFLPLLLALIGGAFLARRGDRFQRFLLFWVVTIFVGLTWAGEKMPWLALHIAVPLILIAANVVDSFVRRLSWSQLNMKSRFSVAVLGVTMAILLALTIRASYMASFPNGDTPVELLIYTQTAPDVPQLMRRIEQAGITSGKGLDLPVVVDSTDSFSWPWAWYLRHYKQATFPAVTSTFEPSPDSVLLLNFTNAGVVTPFQELFGQGIPYHHRWWFPELYRGVTLKSFIVGLAKPSTWERWATYFFERRPPAELGSVDGIAFFPIALADGAGPQDAQSVVRTVGDETIIGRTGIRWGEFLRPAGVAVDATGAMYVLDSNNSRLQKFDSEGKLLQVAGIRGSQPGGFVEPWGIAIDKDGNVYVADTWNHRIQRFDTNLKPVSTWGQPTQNLAQPGPSDLYGPRSIAFDNAGNLFVTDTGNSRVVKYSPDGDVLAVYGSAGSGPGQFREPVGIAIHSDDQSVTIYVADAWNRRIQQFDGEFRYQGEIRIEGWGSQDVLAKPYLTVLPNGRLLFSDPGNGRLGVADPGSGAVTMIEKLPSGEKLSVPIGVSADQKFVYVTDGRENTVRRIDLDALINR